MNREWISAVINRLHATKKSLCQKALEYEMMIFSLIDADSSRLYRCHKACSNACTSSFTFQTRFVMATHHDIRFVLTHRWCVYTKSGNYESGNERANQTSFCHKLARWTQLQLRWHQSKQSKSCAYLIRQKFTWQCNQLSARCSRIVTTFPGALGHIPELTHGMLRIFCICVQPFSMRSSCTRSVLSMITSTVFSMTKL